MLNTYHILRNLKPYLSYSLESLSEKITSLKIVQRASQKALFCDLRVVIDTCSVGPVPIMHDEMEIHVTLCGGALIRRNVMSTVVSVMG